MIVFNHIGKTAGTTLKFIFRNSFGIYHLDSYVAKKKIFTNQDLTFAKKFFFDIKCISGHSLINPVKNVKGSNFYYVTILRDPVMRCISHYQDDCNRRNCAMPIEEWLSNTRWNNYQVKQVAGEENLEKAKELIHKYSLVGLTERFEESLKLLKLTSPYPVNINYLKKIVAKDNTIKKNIMNDKNKLQLIAEKNLLDIDFYEYVVKNVFPLQIKEKQDEMNSLPPPKCLYVNELTLNYQLSMFYNKVVYKLAVKTFK